MDLTLQSDADVKRLAQLLRGTFRSLCGEHELALQDLTVVFNDSQSQVQVCTPLDEAQF